MDAIPELDRAGLRKFGITTGAIVSVLFGLALPWLFGLGYPYWPWVVGGVLIVWGLVAPDSLRPVYRLWMRFGLILHKVTTPLVLGLFYYVVISPLALGMRLFGRRPMPTHADPSAKSYRVTRKKPNVESLEKPF